MILEHPTPYLERCLSTCKMCVEDLASVDLGSKFGEFVAVMPEYIKASSVDTALMEAMSVEKLASCKEFQQNVEEKLQEHVDSFRGIMEQLTRLNDKYKSLDWLMHQGHLPLLLD